MSMGLVDRSKDESDQHVAQRIQQTTVGLGTTLDELMAS